MKSIQYKLALERAKAANDPSDAMTIIACEMGNAAAKSYLRSKYTTVEEYDRLNPQPPFNEDGVCAGFGCDAVIIQ